MTGGRRSGRGGAAGAAALPFPLGRTGRRERAAAPGLLRLAISYLAFEAERRRLFPWIAVAYGGGVLLAFAADGPLSAWPALAAGGLAGAIGYAWRSRPVLLALAIGLSAAFAGFAAYALRVQAVDAPVLGRTTVGRLTGFVENLEERGRGGRLVVLVTGLDGVPPEDRPARVRVTARAVDGVGPGDHVGVTARLLRPPEPARPGGYDFARDAYFRGIGAVGSVLGAVRAAEPPAPPGPALRIAAAIDWARNMVTARIASAIGGQAGAVAAALVTGKRGLIEERTNEVLRAAGIYHVVSISGLHMMLAAGVFFSVTRALLALSSTAALGWPCKKIAAGVGMAGASAYCVFSGSDVAAERSLCMILVMQGAILFDRPALSMRNLALSALIVLTREPETLLGPGFQMSYAAVAGLIALAEWGRGRTGGAEPGDILGRIVRWVVTVVVGTVATTAIATVATAPFATFHFGALQPYGLIGNAATLPLVSLVVMPCAVLGTLAYPFGLDRPVWWLMGVGVDAMLRLSDWVAGLGGSVLVVPAFGAGALLLLVLALLIATLPASPLRWGAVAPAALGILAVSATLRPDVYVARDGTGAAVRGPNGRLLILGRVSAFTSEQWLRADGDNRRGSAADLRDGTRCDPVGCTVATADGRTISVLTDRRGFAEDCRRATVVVSRFAAPPGCAALTLDRQHLSLHGATALRAVPGGFDVTTARRPDEVRPWLRATSGPAPVRARRPSATPAAPAAPPPPPAADIEPVPDDLDLRPGE